jgi:hypothetical protein
MPRPPFVLTEELRASFNALLDGLPTDPARQPVEIDYHLAAPRWQFLCYASEQRGLALHGSPDKSIQRFLPRKANDLREFGNQQAIYAAADGIWPMYFAIIDRARFPTTLVNACIRLESPEGEMSPALYVFSVSREFLARQPWVAGAVYLLPRDTFIADEGMPFGPYRVHPAQLASREPVTPLAYLPVSPQDFPFLADVRGHVDERLPEYAHAMMNTLPWPEE